MSPAAATGLPRMTHTTCHLSISLDGYVAGPDQTREEPLGVGGEELHHWHLGQTDNDVDRAMTARILAPRGAYVMGRNMYAPVVRGPTPRAREWRGWWGEDPPYHAPVFVLTHYPHDPVEMEGGTTFHFVTSFDEAMERAMEAGGRGHGHHRRRRQRGPAGARGGRDRRDHAQPLPAGARRWRVAVRRPRRLAAAADRGARVAEATHIRYRVGR